MIYHNNFINNTHQAFIDGTSHDNVWDDGYPFGGNYWSDYIGVDLYSGPNQDQLGSDGIGDTPYVIDANNTDRYPLMNIFNFTGYNEQTVTVRVRGEEYPVLIISNSTLSHVVATSNNLLFRATGVEGTSGYIWVLIPVNLNTTNIKVFLNGTKITPTISTNGTHYFIYFTFTFTSIYEITILYTEAQFTLTTLYTINLYVNGTIDWGKNLTVKFYSYSGAYQGDAIVWSGTTPAYVTLSINVTHPLNLPIEKATLVLTDDAGTTLETLKTFTVHRSHLMERLAKLDADWIYASPTERTTIFQEIVAIDMQWPYAPP